MITRVNTLWDRRLRDAIHAQDAETYYLQGGIWKVLEIIDAMQKFCFMGMNYLGHDSAVIDLLGKNKVLSKIVHECFETCHRLVIVVGLDEDCQISLIMTFFKRRSVKHTSMITMFIDSSDGRVLTPFEVE